MHRFSALAGTALLILVQGASAHDYKAGTLTIEHPWTRATPRGAAVAGGFMKITNTGSASDRLIGGSLVASKSFEVHETTLVGDVMRMRHLSKGLEIRPGQTVELRPGSFHVMFMGLRQPLAQGQHVKGTLVFEKAGTVDVEYEVQALGSGSGNDTGPDSGGGHHKH